MLHPPRIQLPETHSGDPRIGHLLGRACTAETARVVLVGFPSDAGVRINGGRAGAAQGPGALREWLYRMTPDTRDVARFTEIVKRTIDIGDLEISGDVATDQNRLADVLAPFLERAAVPVVLGGGHETAFGHFLAHAQSGRRVEIVNWDAHPDVRALRDGRAHSGSPFRQAVEHASKSCRRYSVFGLAAHQTASAHVEFVRSHGGQVMWNNEITEAAIRDLYDEIDAPAMISFDLDAVDQSLAPGVSAPCANGLSARHWLAAAREAGRSASVASMDVVELNPLHDVDHRTARLAALTVWSIFQGLAERPLRTENR